MTLTRLYRFAASHRLHSGALSEAENARLYGKCNNPFGHGHDYTLEVAAMGKADPISGLILPVGQLDAFVQDKILRHFAHRNINLDVPQFAQLVPTTENLAIVIGDFIQEYWPVSFKAAGAHPNRIHIQETGRNGFEVFFSKPILRSAQHQRKESVTVHV